jgi:uncharacterized protein
MADTTNRLAGNGQVTVTQNQLAVFSELVSRINFAKQHGLQYGGDRDVFEVAGYETNLTYDDFHRLYERMGLAKKLIDMPAETTWRAPPEVVEPDMPEDGTEFSREWQGLAKRLRIWSRMERLDKLARKGRYAVMLIGTPDGDDQNLRTPMPNLSGPDDVLYLEVYSEKYARIHQLVSDPTDPRHRLPEIYNIDLGGDIRQGSVQAQTNTVQVHWTRVAHVAEDLLEDDIFGLETLRPVWNHFHDLLKVSASTAEAFWQRVAGILQATVDPDAKVSDAELDALDDALKEVYHDLRKTFLGEGIELSRLAESEPNPEAAAALYITLIAAGSPIPKRMLIGSETGERASTEDQKSYYGAIAERQVQHAEPNMLRPFIDRLIEHRALPRPTAEDYDVVWPSLFKEPEKDTAEANRARAQAAKDLTPMGGDPLSLVEVDEDRNVWLRPTGDRGVLTPEELEPPEPEPVEPEPPEAEAVPEGEAAPEEEPVA